MTYPQEFSRITLPYGVTTVVADAHEIANVFGLEGIRCFMEQKTPQDIFYAIPVSYTHLKRGRAEFMVRESWRVNHGALSPVYYSRCITPRN